MKGSTWIGREFSLLGSKDLGHFCEDSVVLFGLRKPSEKLLLSSLSFLYCSGLFNNPLLHGIILMVLFAISRCTS